MPHHVATQESGGFALWSCPQLARNRNIPAALVMTRQSSHCSFMGHHSMAQLLILSKHWRTNQSCQYESQVVNKPKTWHKLQALRNSLVPAAVSLRHQYYKWLHNCDGCVQYVYTHKNDSQMGDLLRYCQDLQWSLPSHLCYYITISAHFVLQQFTEVLMLRVIQS